MTKIYFQKKTQSNSPAPTATSKGSEIYCLFVYNFFKITLGTTKKN